MKILVFGVVKSASRLSQTLQPDNLAILHQSLNFLHRQKGVNRRERRSKCALVPAFALLRRGRAWWCAPLPPLLGFIWFYLVLITFIHFKFSGVLKCFSKAESR
jgi:hypothetical protein